MFREAYYHTNLTIAAVYSMHTVHIMQMFYMRRIPVLQNVQQSLLCEILHPNANNSTSVISVMDKPKVTCVM